MTWVEIIVGIVALQQIAELMYSRQNVYWLLQMGAVELGPGHYPVIIAMPFVWLAAIFIGADPNASPIWWLIGVYIALEIVRYWAMFNLRGYWTLKIIAVPDEPLVRTGPYRYVSHPIYIAYVAGGLILPLAFDEVWTAVIFTMANLGLFAWRIKIEDPLLAQRRTAQRPVVRSRTRISAVPRPRKRPPE